MRWGPRAGKAVTKPAATLGGDMERDTQVLETRDPAQAELFPRHASSVGCCQRAAEPIPSQQLQFLRRKRPL